MKEASKTNQFRQPDFFQTYLSGTVLDIGAGNDLVCPHAQGFDMEHGDANHLDRYFAPASFDALHSSHSLEHMVDPVAVLARWWSLVKPGGYLIVVVPDEDLYEQGIWPSAFNSDHKSTFRLGKSESWSPVSHDILALCKALPASEVVSADLQCFNFDPALVFPRGMTPKRKYARWMKWMFSIAKRMPGGGPELVRKLKIRQIRKGHPLDQTAYDACAQIQVVVRKAA